MPRRDAISEKKRERLMQEHEQLQKLMLQARSSVRRSSMKEQPEQNAPLPEETNAMATEGLENTPEMPEERSAVNPEETGSIEKSPLTEKDLFPAPNEFSESKTKRPPLTEKDVFPEVTSGSTAFVPSQQSRIVNVILPDQNIAATVAQRNTTPEEGRYANFIQGDTALQDEPSVEESNSIPDENPIENRSRSKPGYLLLLIGVVLLAGAAGYYFYYQNGKTHATIATRNSTPIPPSTTVTQPEKQKDSAAVQTMKEAEPDVFQTPNKDKPVTTNAEKQVEREAVSTLKKEAEAPATTNGNLGQYKVISKAYFHDAPDESTRRKAFIIHWNNAVLKPLDEKNGFVYVVFTNHLGQTSKGWLRKQDLKRIDE